jgi:hypothetical protein
VVCENFCNRTLEKDLLANPRLFAPNKTPSKEHRARSEIRGDQLWDDDMFKLWNVVVQASLVPKTSTVANVYEAWKYGKEYKCDNAHAESVVKYGEVHYYYYYYYYITIIITIIAAKQHVAIVILGSGCTLSFEEKDEVTEEINRVDIAIQRRSIVVFKGDSRNLKFRISSIREEGLRTIVMKVDKTFDEEMLKRRKQQNNMVYRIGSSIDGRLRTLKAMGYEGNRRSKSLSEIQLAEEAANLWESQYVDTHKTKLVFREGLLNFVPRSIEGDE